MIGLGLGLVRQAVRNASGQAWTPAALFANGEQGVWYEPRPQYLYQDAAGTTPVTSDGDPVGRMLDLSGNGNHATQSTSARRPTYRTDGTLHWLEFDGVDDGLLGASLLSGVEPFTISIALNAVFSGQALYKRMFSNNRSEANTIQFSSRDSGSTVQFGRTGAPFASTNQGVSGLSTVLTGELSSLFRDGDEQSGPSDENQGAGPADTSALGWRGDNTGTCTQMDFYGIVGVQSEGSRMSIETYLATRAGITL